ncbi:MAG: hypothetical protein HYS12_15015 [Planctomycetes bacterium]|nr:hypothetical protein [Planctomycetota bacterium]
MPRTQTNRRPVLRRGKIIVLVALSLIGIVGIVAIAADGGLMLDQRRRVQAVADAAALAAASDMFKNYPTYSGVDTQGTALDVAKSTAAAMGYTNDQKTSFVTVNIPPKNGDHIGQTGYVEVIIEYRQSRTFSGIFGSSDMPIKARAVARGRWVPFKNGILVLDLTTSEALKANGGGTISVTGADIIVNSTDPQSVGGDGTGATIQVTDGNFVFAGGVKSNTTLIGPTPLHQDTPTPDPLAYLPEPTLPATAIKVNAINPNAANAKGYLDALGLQAKDINGKVYVLDPGRYDSMPNFNNGDVVILKQASADGSGIYYLNGSGFTSTGATIAIDPTGATTGGIMFYNDPLGKTSNGINITGGKVTINPPSSGIYKGISIFQERSADVPLSITGQGGMQITGTFYVAGGTIKITGSNSTTLDVIGSQYISRTLESGGNGKYAVSWQVDQTARLRQLQLVE